MPSNTDFRHYPRTAGLAAIREATATLVDLRRMLRNLPIGKHILWVDDQPDNNEIIRKLLEDAGASIVLAQSTDAAVSILREASNKFDLVISDMCRGKNLVAGLELLNYVHDTSANLPSIIYSSNPEANVHKIEINKLGAIGPVLGPKNLIIEISRLF